ncbi:MAG TPA: phage major capsid protein [Gemmatimonadales bacterium]|nr:phage major capsid protein [Gemmatimonadales bacterium]
MAATPNTLTDLNNLAKDYWTNIYVQAANPEVPLKAQFGRLENAQFTGRVWIFGVKTAIGGGSGNAGANQNLPGANVGQYAQGQVNVVRTYTRMALDGLAIEVTKKQSGSFRPALAEVMSDRLQAHDLEVNRQMFSDGTTLAVSQVSTGANSTTQTVTNGDYGFGNALGTKTNGGNGVRHIYIGDVVQFYAASSGAPTGSARAGGPFTVSAVSASAQTFTVTGGTPNTTTGDLVVRATATTDNTVAGEASGITQATFDSGTFETINPSTVGQAWKGVRLANGGTLRDISDSLVMQTIETLRARSRMTPDLAVCRPGIVLKYSEIFLPLRRLDGQDVQLKGGYKPMAAIIHAGGAIPVIGDNDCPNSRLFFLNTSAFKLADVVGTDWADMDGAVFDRVVDKDAIEGYLRKYWNLACIQRNASGVIEDLNDVAAIDKVA